MKIYTRTGDDGSTGLIGGDRVRKCDARLDCYGTIDELNSLLGLALVVAPGPVRAYLAPVQADLFVLGAHLAAPEPPPASQFLPPLDEQLVSRLEMQIDQMTEHLAPLRNFVLPGGGETAARLHVARTVCRRAERLTVDFALNRPVPSLVLTYLNRLSDWLFTLARYANHVEGIADVPWHPEPL
jgi:cob(I)alamin adenosyltransferase